MKWKGRQGSSNVDDRRRGPGKGTVGLGIGGIVVILIVYLLGGDPSQLIQQGLQQGTGTTQDESAVQATDELAQFVSVVLKDTEDIWHKIFREQLNARYEEPKLVLFSNSVESRCGYASAATGPFYCPGDQQVYIDLSFYQDLKNRFKAPGDFAMAYVVAHEVGHHVQNLLGISGEVQRQRNRISQEEYNRLSVMLELQADFFAGMWAHYAENTLGVVEKGDLEEALNAARAIGDDRLQMQARGYVVPESFTHGTSEQRMKWFYKGYTTGNLDEGDTFGATDL